MLHLICSRFPVTDELLEPLLEGLTIDEAIKQKRVFMTDLEIMQGLPVKEGNSVSLFASVTILTCKHNSILFRDHSNIS